MENWIILNSTTGNSGKTQITLQVAENTNYSARTTTLTVRTRSKNLTDTVVINQQARAATGQMTFNPSALSYTYEGGTIPFSITANEDWRVVSWPTWVGISGDGTSGGTGTYNWGVTALRNSTTSDLDSTFTFYCGGNYFTVPVHQDAYSEQSDIVFSGYTYEQLSTPLTMSIISGGTLYWRTSSMDQNHHETIEWSKNNGEWQTVWIGHPVAALRETITTVEAGDVIRFRNYKRYYGGTGDVYYGSFDTDNTVKYNISGNIMSLQDGDNFADSFTCNSRDFVGLFNKSGVVSAKDLYLPATELAYRCYARMFDSCNSLIAAPALPATTLVDSCYQQMFSGCSNLDEILCLATDISAYNCTNNWVNGVAANGVFYKNKNMNGWTVGVSGIPSGWVTRNCILNGWISSPTEQTIRSAKYFNIDINSNTGWTISNLPEWLTVDSNSGNLNKKVQFTAEKNLTSSERTATVIFTTTNGMQLFFTLINERYIYTEPLTFVFLTNGRIEWVSNTTSSLYSKTISYSKDNGNNWTSINSKDSPRISVVSGDVVEFKGDNVSYSTNSTVNRFRATGNFYIKGNIMSLINSTDFSGNTELQSAYTFNNLFQNCTGLTDASELILPATTLTESCYQGMFSGCTSLTQTPELPATTLANYCYKSMFSGCTSLTTAPELLPATTLTRYCYQYMFDGCTNLTAAPELPATILTTNCYDTMFRNCSSLNYIKCLATDFSAHECTHYWVSGVASRGTFVKAAGVNWPIGAYGIPSSYWTVQDAS